MVLTGGGALLRDLDRLLMEETGLPVHRRRRSADLRRARLRQGAREDGAASARSSPTTEGPTGDKGPRTSPGMEHTPPPFFKRGPAPLVRLFFFASLSLALLVLDARFRYADGLRSVLALAAYPLQRAATAPIDVAARGRRLLLHRRRSLSRTTPALRAKQLALLAGARSATRRRRPRTRSCAACSGAAEQLDGASRRRPKSSTPARSVFAQGLHRSRRRGRACSRAAR